MLHVKLPQRSVTRRVRGADTKMCQYTGPNKIIITNKMEVTHIKHTECRKQVRLTSELLLLICGIS